MTNKPYIALAVNHNGRVWQGQFDMAPQFYIYDREGYLLEVRENLREDDRFAALANRQPLMSIRALDDCGTFIGRQTGPYSITVSGGAELFISTESTPPAAIQDYLTRRR
jgi:hypothetical protein